MIGRREMIWARTKTAITMQRVKSTPITVAVHSSHPKSNATSAVGTAVDTPAFSPAGHVSYAPVSSVPPAPDEEEPDDEAEETRDEDGDDDSCYQRCV